MVVSVTGSSPGRRANVGARVRGGLTLPLLMAALLLMAACGDDSAAPEPLQPNTPPVPTITNAGDQLPANSTFLVAERATLREFSPDLTGLTPAMLDKLNEAVVLDFRLLPGRSRIVTNGRPCFPDRLQFSETTGWFTLSRASLPWPYQLLGQYGGSYYYLCPTASRWMYADVNCRSLGGHLASLTSAGESDFVVDALGTAGISSAFIGLTDWGRANNDWIWTSGEPYGWSSWAAGEPNNSNGEQFAHIYYPGGKWNDTNFVAAYPYVLERSSPLPDPGSATVSCAAYGGSPLFIDALAGPEVAPKIERRLYWQKVFQVTVGAGATYAQEHTYTHGTSETTGMSFGWSIGISVSADWGFVSAAIETEFHQDFSHEVTISSEESITKSYSATAPADKIMVLALWQLRERYVITDDMGTAWQDPGYILASALPALDQGLEEEYLQTIYFDAP